MRTNLKKDAAGLFKDVTWLFWISCGISIFISFFATLLGAFRPYDAIPDQDLLWLKEGLRLFSSLHVTYPDHPGIYWSLSYAIKIKILSALGLVQLLPGQTISPVDAQTVISLSRLENGLVIGLASALIWPIARLMQINKWLASAIVVSSSLSLGFLEATAQVRNEITSFFFLELFTLISLYLSRGNHQPIPHRREASFVALTCFLISVYCKIQVLLLYPAPLLLIAFKQNKRLPWQETLLHLSRGKSAASLWISSIGIILLGGWLPWSLATRGPIFAASNRLGHMRSDIDQPVWIAINLGVLACIITCANEQIRWKEIWKSILAYNIIITLFARIFAHRLWTSQVFSFPSNSLTFASTGEGGRSIAKGIQGYVSDLFAGPPDFALTLLVFLVALALFASFSRPGNYIKASASVTILATWIANALRIQGFYEIYLYPITILSMASIIIPSAERKLTEKTAKTISCILISLALVKSFENIKEIPRIAQMRQPQEFLCFEQSHDLLLSDLTVASCENFKVSN